MGIFRKKVKKVVESLTGFEVERFGSKSYALIDKENRTRDAWFSYRIQLRSIIEKDKINLVIDVGANEGQYAKKLRSFYSGEMFSFEPVSFVFEKLAKAASTDPMWRVYKMALGSQESTQTINVSEDTVFSSLLRTNEKCVQIFGDSAQGQKKEVVVVQRLDKLLKNFVGDIGDKRIFLKMDTQGYDTEVFGGLGSTAKNVIALQSEISLIPIYQGTPHWTESISIYEKAGFGIVGMFPVTRDSGRVIEYDCLLTRIES